METDVEKMTEFQERRKHLASTLDAIKMDFEKKNYGGSLMILGPVIDALANATAAQILEKGTAPLLLSLRIALLGIESEKSSAGVLGKSLCTTANGISNLVVSSFLDKEDVGSRKLFKLLTQALVLVVISIAWKLEQFDFSLRIKENEEEAELKEKNLFGFELMILLILRTEMIQTVVKNITEACGANKLQQESIAKLIKALILILALLTGAKGDQETLKKLTLDLKDYLKEGLRDIQEFLNTINEAVKIPESVTAISISLQQALESLEGDDFDILYKAYAESLQNIESSPESMQHEIEAVSEFAEILFNAFAHGALEVSQKTTASLMI